MQFDSVASQDQAPVPAAQISGADEDYIDREIEREESSPAPRREGLPAAFRMRHSRHYVEQLMGDAPIRTVREIPIGEIEPPPDETADVQELERSIRQFGVLEPLLVGRHGRRYRVIAGMNRLRAAGRAGLRSVPCLVHEVDDEMLNNMREAATQRATPSSSDAPAAEAARQQPPLPPAFAEVTAGLNFVSALLPAIHAAGDDRFRWSVLTDLASVELSRARTVAAAAELLSNSAGIVRGDVRVGDLLEAVTACVQPEARLRGTVLSIEAGDPDYRMPLDRGVATMALVGLVQTALALAATPGARVEVRMTGTTIRPALVVEAAVPHATVAADAYQRFFEGDWPAHPAGASGALMLAAAARVARLHGGRVDAKPHPAGGCVLTLVIPRPLTF